MSLALLHIRAHGDEKWNFHKLIDTWEQYDDEVAKAEKEGLVIRAEFADKAIQNFKDATEAEAADVSKQMDRS